MALDNGLAKAATSEKTTVATLVAIAMVLPATIPAAIAVALYTVVFNWFTGGPSLAWMRIVPYVYEVGSLWFPELLRGMIVGGAAILTSRYFFPRSNVEAVKLATLTFWGALLIALLLFSVTIRGMTFDLIGVLALLVGLGGGLWTGAMDE